MKKRRKEKAGGGDDVVGKLVHFQRTGAGFDDVWTDVQPIIAEFARRNLRKRGVRFHAIDDAVDDVVNSTAERLMRLALPDAGGRFDPARVAKPGMSGVRGWLWRVVQRQAANWSRDERGSRGVKISRVSDLEWNEPPTSDDESSILKRLVAKLERADLLPILHECIDQLTDPAQRRLLRMGLDEGFSQRRIGERLGKSATTIHRRLQEAYALLRPMLEDRGIDADWLTA